MCLPAVCSGSHVYILLSLDTKLGLTVNLLSLTRATWAGLQSRTRVSQNIYAEESYTTHIMFIHNLTDVNKVDMLKLINRMTLYNELNLKITK